MSSSRQPPNPVRSLLEEAETDLSRRLREVCEAEAKGVSTDSAAEIRQLEDSLLAAAMAAERAYAAQRHLHGETTESGARSSQAPPDRERVAKAQPESDPERDTARAPASRASGVREFQDTAGRSWRAWPVTPGAARARQGGTGILGDFQEGWICFEALDDSGRRRLPRREPGWADLPARDLQRLLEQAIDAPTRKARRPDASASSDAGEVH